MKEYLTKNSSGNYQLVNHRFNEDDIVVPEGANKLTKCGMALYFWDTLNNKTYVDGSGWMDCDNDALFTFESYTADSDVSVVWVRESLNDKIATAEVARQDILKPESFSAVDNVNHPSHYCGHPSGIECIDAIESSMSEEAFKGFLKGNIQKYIWRYEGKGGLESLHKAEWYIRKLIGVIECSMEKDSVD